MQDTNRPRNVKAIEAALATARALVASLEAALVESDTADIDLLDVRTTLRQYNIGRDGLIAAARRGEIELRRGPRSRILVVRDELERWLRSRPHRPKPRRSTNIVNLADWEAEVEREISAVGGRK